MNRRKQILSCAGALLFVLVLLSGIYAAARPGDTLRIACQEFTGNFSPFFADTKTDMEVVDVCFDRLVTLDRAGNILHNPSRGEQTTYDGVYYTYYGIADVKVQYDEASDRTTCVWTLADGLRFQDGTYADADDIIFSYYVFLDPAYAGPYAVYAVPIVGLSEYREGGAAYIEGIRRIDSRSVAVTFEGDDPDDIRTLGINLCPLHYYADEGKYDYDRHQFGFAKGELTALEQKSSDPLGTGPYRPVHSDTQHILFKANRYYFSDEPVCTRMEFIRCSDAQCAERIASGEIDIAAPTLSAALSASIRAQNANANLSGNRIRTIHYESDGYGYIGIHAENVSVGAEADSAASKALRRAFATVFTLYRKDAVSAYFGEDLPFGEEEFRLSTAGSPVFTDEMSPQARETAVRQAVIELLQFAGFQYDGSRFTAAAEGAKLHYTARIAADGCADHPCYEILRRSAALLSGLGLTLEIEDVRDQIQLWQSLDAGTAEIWCAAWENPEAYQLYHSANRPGQSASTGSNYYAISDPALDRLLSAPAADMQSCRRLVNAWAVEVPVYRRTGCLLYSAARIRSGIVHNPTSYHGWLDEIARIEKNG